MENLTNQDYSPPPKPESLKPYISSFTNFPPGCHILRKSWVQLNHLRTGHGRFNVNHHRTGLADNKNCVCSDIQFASHILYHCTVMAPPCSITNTTNEDLPFTLNRIVLPPVNYVHTTEEYTRGGCTWTSPHPFVTQTQTHTFAQLDLL